MKFLELTTWPVEKTPEVSAASDKVWAKTPRERRAQSSYVLMCVPFDTPPDSMVSVAIIEGDSAEEIAASIYPVTLAGASINLIPLLEVPFGGSVKAEKKYRG